jgi:hypothetical protein
MMASRSSTTNSDDEDDHDTTLPDSPMNIHDGFDISSNDSDDEDDHTITTNLLQLSNTKQTKRKATEERAATLKRQTFNNTAFTAKKLKRRNYAGDAKWVDYSGGVYVALMAGRSCYHTLAR